VHGYILYVFFWHIRLHGTFAIQVRYRFIYKAKSYNKSL